MGTFAQAREMLIDDLHESGVNDIGAQLAEAEAVLCDDGVTVLVYVPNGVGWWAARSFDLPTPIDPQSFDATAVEQMLTLSPATMH